MDSSVLLVVTTALGVMRHFLAGASEGAAKKTGEALVSVCSDSPPEGTMRHRIPHLMFLIKTRTKSTFTRAKEVIHPPGFRKKTHAE